MHIGVNVKKPTVFTARWTLNTASTASLSLFTKYNALESQQLNMLKMRSSTQFATICIQ